MTDPRTYIAYTRLDAATKAGLDAIVANFPGSQSAHICQAVAEYVDRLLPTLAQAPQADAITLREPAS